MTKLIFDLDGVIITYEKNFAETYSAEFGVGVEKIYDFFSTDYRACAIGQATLRAAMEKYVALWSWPDDTDSLIKYWFDCQSTVDANILGLIGSAREAGYACYVASDQDAMRSSYVRELIDFDHTFDGRFFSCDLGTTKTDTAFFERMLGELGCAPHEAYFWDDNAKNVTTAQSVGINAEIYRDYTGFEQSFVDRFAAEEKRTRLM
jgi:putative hydrolase of the HAD superfamily